MARVITKFIITSIFMWVLPQLVLRAFSKVATGLSPQAHTLWSGGLAVLSVNIVIGIYIYLALKEPQTSPNPDPNFVSKAQESLVQEQSKSSTDQDLNSEDLPQGPDQQETKKFN